MAPMTMAPLTAWLVTIHGWRTTLLIIAGIAAMLMIPAALLVRRPPALDGGPAETAADEPQADMTVRQAVRSPQFLTPDAGELLLLRDPFRPAGRLGMSTGPLLGGVIYDHFDSYVLMYVGSWGMGLAAMLMLMAFRPFPGRQTEMEAA